MVDIVEEARQFALECHKYQRDEDGNSFCFVHLNPVVNILRNVTDDKEILAAAYLHDVLEDTEATEKELRRVFGDRVTNLVLELTHEGKKDSHGYYFPRLKSKEAIMIKFADRLQNLSRIDSWDLKRQEQYLKRSKFWRSEKNNTQKDGDERRVKH